MTISTKYDVGEKVFIINKDKIVELAITKIITTSHSRSTNPYIEYTFLESKAATNLDRDSYITRDETACFSTAEQLVASSLKS